MVLNMNLSRYLLLCAVLVFIAACSSLPDDPNKVYAGQSADDIFKKAQTALVNKKYSKVISALEALDALYPFNPHSEQSQLNLIYAYYVTDDFASAAVTAKRFIQLYPRNQHVDYAYYMQGLANFEPALSFLEKRLHIDVSKRDEQNTHQAFQDFKALVERFPNSPYSPDARQHMLFLRNEFARHELNIAKFYFKRKLYVAAVNRASDVVAHYQRSPSVPEALQLLVKAYTELDLPEQAADSQRLLTLNFQDQTKNKQSNLHRTVS